MSRSPAATSARRPAGRRVWPVRITAALAWLAALAATVAGVLGPASQPAQMIVFVGVVAVYLACGTLIVERAPGNAVGPIVFLIGVLIATYVVLDPVVRNGGRGGPAYLGAFVVHELDGPVYLLAVLLFLRFPDGRLPSPAWRWLAVAAWVLAVVVVLGAATRPGPYAYYPDLTNPLGAPDSPLASVWGAAYMLLVGLVGAAALSLVVRWRDARPATRAQLKWVAGAAVLLAIAMLTYGGDVGPGAYSQVGDLLVGIGFALVPVAITIAILRYRLYEIDRVISRSIGWAVVTTVIVVVFVVAVVALQALLAGVTQGQTLAVAGSTLLVFALFQPVRARIQRAVDRRFDRTRYDADRIAVAFGEQLGHDANLDGATHALRAAATRAMQPSATAVWLRQGPGS